MINKNHKKLICLMKIYKFILKIKNNQRLEKLKIKRQHKFKKNKIIFKITSQKKLMKLKAL